MATNALAMPPEEARKRLRVMPRRLAVSPASSAIRASTCFCCSVCGIGKYSPLDTTRVGTGEARGSASSARRNAPCCAFESQLSSSRDMGTSDGKTEVERWPESCCLGRAMIAQSCRLAATVVLLGVAFPGLAEPPPDTPSSAPLGKGSAPGSTGPADGAIKGGSIVPGESSGVPTDRQISRCADLAGTFPEKCLTQEKGAASGGTTLRDADVVKPPTTREAPPPQNPQPRSN